MAKGMARLFEWLATFGTDYDFSNGLWLIERYAANYLPAAVEAIRNTAESIVDNQGQKE